MKLGYEIQHFSTTLEGWVLKVFNFIYIPRWCSNKSIEIEMQWYGLEGGSHPPSRVFGKVHKYVEEWFGLWIRGYIMKRLGLDISLSLSLSYCSVQLHIVTNTKRTIQHTFYVMSHIKLLYDAMGVELVSPCQLWRSKKHRRASMGCHDMQLGH